MGSLVREEISKNDHICRYCKRAHIIEGRITGPAFLPRNDEEYISVNWLEYFKLDNRKKEIQEIRNTLQKKLSISMNAKIAVLKIGKMVNYVYGESPDHRILSVRHKPEEGDLSHSGIFGLKNEQDRFIAVLIAETIQESYPAKE